MVEVAVGAAAVAPPPSETGRVACWIWYRCLFPWYEHVTVFRWIPAAARVNITHLSVRNLGGDVLGDRQYTSRYCAISIIRCLGYISAIQNTVGCCCLGRDVGRSSARARVGQHPWCVTICT